MHISLKHPETPAQYRDALTSALEQANKLVAGFIERVQAVERIGLAKASQYYQAAATASLFKEALYSLAHGPHVGKDVKAQVEYFETREHMALQRALATPPHDASPSMLQAFHATAQASLALYDLIRHVQKEWYAADCLVCGQTSVGGTPYEGCRWLCETHGKASEKYFGSMNDYGDASAFATAYKAKHAKPVAPKPEAPTCRQCGTPLEDFTCGRCGYHNNTKPEPKETA